MSWWRQVGTDYDNATWDTGRVIGVTIAASGIGFQAWALALGQQFSAIGYLSGMGALLGALGVYLFGDNHRRPDQKGQP